MGREAKSIRASAVIVGPAEDTGSSFVPRIVSPFMMTSGQDPEDPKHSARVEMSREECEAFLDRKWQEYQEREEVRPIRAHTMEERDAIFTFIRETVDLLAEEVRTRAGIYGHERFPSGEPGT